MSRFHLDLPHGSVSGKINHEANTEKHKLGFRGPIKIELNEPFTHFARRHKIGFMAVNVLWEGGGGHSEWKEAASLPAGLQINWGLFLSSAIK